jgi:AbrB family looped-hinge helix DNA binding protein
MTQADEGLPSAELAAAREGRVTIPAQLRRAAGIHAGQRLVVYVERGRVVIEQRDHLLARVQQEAIDAATAAGHTTSAVDELIAERRAEAARDSADSDSENGDHVDGVDRNSP